MCNCSTADVLVADDFSVTGVEINASASGGAFSGIATGADGSTGQGAVGLVGGADSNVLFSPETSLCLFIAYTFVFCCCFFGNLLVILVVCLNRRMRTTTNFFLVNLAIADLCVGTFCVYQNISLYLMEKWIFGNFLCKMYHFVHGMSYTASILILTVISVERYLAICHPMWSKRVITLNRLRIVVCFVWLIAAAYSSPKLIIYGVIRYDIEDQPGELCVMRRERKSSYHRMHKIYDLINFIVCFVVPLAIISVLYTFICLRLWKSQDMLRTIQPKNETADGKATLIATGTTLKGAQVTLTITNDSQQASLDDKEISQSIGSTLAIEKGQHVLATPTHSSQVHRESLSELPSSLSQPLAQQEVQVNGRTLVITPPPTSSRSLSPTSLSRFRFRFCSASLSLSRQVSRDSPTVTEHRIRTSYGSSQRSNASITILRARRNVIRLLVVVLLCFAACNLPFHARKLYQNWGSSYDGARLPYVVMTMVTHLILYLNSGINPFIYALFSRNFRQCMRDVLLCSIPALKGNTTTATQLGTFSTNGHLFDERRRSRLNPDKQETHQPSRRTSFTSQTFVCRRGSSVETNRTSRSSTKNSSQNV